MTPGTGSGADPGGVFTEGDVPLDQGDLAGVREPLADMGEGSRTWMAGFSGGCGAVRRSRACGPASSSGRPVPPTAPLLSRATGELQL
jgi:hypothetical protein